MSIKRLYEQWIDPLADAINFMRLDEFDRLYAAYQATLDDADLSPDMHQALKYILAYHLYARNLCEHGAVAGEHEYELLRQCFRTKPQGTISQMFLNRYLLQARIVADNMGFSPLSNAEFHQLLAELPPENRHNEQWFAISVFALKRQDLELVQQTYHEYLLVHSDFEADFTWRRLETMLKLLEHRATKIDAQLLIQKMTIPSAIFELKRFFWPLFMAQGLVDEQLYELLAEKETELKLLTAQQAATSSLESISHSR